MPIPGFIGLVLQIIGMAYLTVMACIILHRITNPTKSDAAIATAAGITVAVTISAYRLMRRSGVMPRSLAGTATRTEKSCDRLHLSSPWRTGSVHRYVLPARV